jgi:YYY domain-containing protein
MLKKAIYLLITIILIVIGNILLQSDFTPFLQWWITITCIGIIFLPITTLVFGRFHDKGYLFSKPIGLAITGYVMWFLSSLHILKFTALSCIICAGIGLIANGIILVLRKNYQKNELVKSVNREESFISLEKLLDTILGEELLFFGLFLLFVYIRGFKPEAYGTEKFMDYGFMTSMMRSEYMPPQDFWFSGTSLNYYYVGQYLATFLTKLSFVKVFHGYNLMLMMVGALSFVLCYSLIYNIVVHYMQEREKQGKWIPITSGLLGGAAVVFAGNMHYPTYQWFESWVRKFFGMEASTDDYWFPDATRFIGYHPETNDKTIHEFPAYSFVLGDLHAHVINIIFVLTVLGILFAWMCYRRAQKRRDVPFWKDIINPAFLLVAFFIGLFHTTNFWDFPIYFVVSGAIILFTNLIVNHFRVKTVFVLTVLQGIFIFCASEIVALPFTLRFDQISTNICLSVAHTPLNQLIILWGLPIFAVIAFLCFIISDIHKRQMIEYAAEINLQVQQEAQRSQVVQTDTETRKAKRTFEIKLTDLSKNLTTSDLFIITIGLCAIGLVLIPEVVYVQDIYSGDYKRANTMFKLTYQAFIMFGIVFGYILLRLLRFGTTKRQKKVAAVVMLLFLLTICYIQNAVNSWYGNIFKVSEYKGIDATEFMETTMPDDDLAIDWLNKNVSGMPVVLEAPGDSYTDYERVSVMTGLPTILGWHTHEWLWKGDTSLLDARTSDIEKIYTSSDEAYVRTLLEKYNVSYIYVGKLEQDKYTTMNHEMLKRLGKVVFLSPMNETKDYETYILRIK